MNLLLTIPESAQNYQQVQDRLSKYQESLYLKTFQDSITKAETGYLSEAITTLQTIPQTSLVYTQAQGKIVKYEELANVQKAEQMLETAVNYANESNYENTIKYLNYAIQLNKNFARAYALRGLFRAELGDRIGSLEDVNKSISLEPQCDDYYLFRGIIYTLFKEHQEAIENLNYTIELNPKNARSYQERGTNYFFLKDENKGNEDLQKAAQIFFEEGDIVAYKEVLELMQELQQNFMVMSLESQPPIRATKAKLTLERWSLEVDDIVQ